MECPHVCRGVENGAFDKAIAAAINGLTSAISYDTQNTLLQRAFDKTLKWGSLFSIIDEPNSLDLAMTIVGPVYIEEKWTVQFKLERAEVVYNTYTAFASAVVAIIGSHMENAGTMQRLQEARRTANARFSQISKVYGKRGRKPIKLIDHF